MSWSVVFIGKPENVAAALNEQSEKLDGASKVEYDAALPHLVGIVEQNFGENSPAVKITANGHGYTNGEQSSRQLTVSIELMYGTLV
jgi:hypothetical protein